MTRRHARRPSLLRVLALALFGALFGCGQMGPLALPDAAADSADASARDDADDDAEDTE